MKNPQEQLTTLASLKGYLGVTTTNDDVVLGALIFQASAVIDRYCRRRFTATTYTEVYDGPRAGGTRLFLRHYPILSVSSLVVDGVVIPLTVLQTGSAFPQTGYLASEEYIDLYGTCFSTVPNSVIITYEAGVTVEEDDMVPSATPFNVSVSSGTWLADIGVNYANGTALTKVDSNPAQGEYAVVTGAYTFAAADTSQDVVISYSCVPEDVEGAAMELAGYAYRQRARLGLKSQSLAGETTAYDLSNIPEPVKQLLAPHVMVWQVY